MPAAYREVHQVEYDGLELEVIEHPGLYYTPHHQWVEAVGGCPCMEEMVRIGTGGFACKAYGKPNSSRAKDGVVGSELQQREAGGAR